MADYPNIPQVMGSQIFAADGTVMDRAVSGKPRLRSYYPDVQFTAQVLHDVDGPDKDAVWAHYLAHRFVAFDMLFRANNGTYSVRYTEPPAILPIPGTDRWSLTSKFVVVG